MHKRVFIYSPFIKSWWVLMTMLVLFYCSPLRRIVEDRYYNADLSLVSQNLDKKPKVSHRIIKEDHYINKLEQCVVNTPVDLIPALIQTKVYTYSIFVNHYNPAEVSSTLPDSPPRYIKLQVWFVLNAVTFCMWSSDFPHSKG